MLTLTLLDERFSNWTLVSDRRGHLTRQKAGMNTDYRTRSRPGKTPVLLWFSGPMRRRRRHIRRTPGFHACHYFYLHHYYYFLRAIKLFLS